MAKSSNKNQSKEQGVFRQQTTVKSGAGDKVKTKSVTKDVTKKDKS